MTHVCAHDAGRRRDPTGTGSIRRRYEAALVRRFRLIRRLTWEAIVDLDVLGLRPQSSVAASVVSASFARSFNPPLEQDLGAVTRDAAPPPAKAFAFARSSEKVSSFTAWLKQSAREGILEISLGSSMESASRTAWQNVYIDTAYQKGIRDASARLGRASTGFNQPVHAERVGLIYTRAFNDLDGVTDAMSLQMSRALAQGIAEGRGHMSIARDLVDRVDRIGITRARVLARTETISAYAEGSLTEYEEAGIEGVSVEAELVTAEDDSVCPECEELEGKTFDIEEARGMIPVHPNCRCAFLPVVA